MSDRISRRRFLSSTAAAAAGTTLLGGSPASIAHQTTAEGNGRKRATRPLVIASGNGLEAVRRAVKGIGDGDDPLDAVIAGVNTVELDPEDDSVGLGGLPNEDGVVELDSSVMHGPKHAAGAVAALRNISTPSRVARMVLERTDHVLLVGKGALRFARAHGFEETDLLTDAARERWLRWKESRPDDDWIPAEIPDGQQASADHPFVRHHGTINCCAVTQTGDLAGVTTTSGLAFKLPGRVGDSPIIGAGLYVDNAVGAAGATGRGEAVILNCGSFSVVEQMRQGKHPTDACLEVLRRIVANNRIPRLRRGDGRPNFDVKMYAVNKKGEYGSASIWSRARFAVADAESARLEDCAYLFDRDTRQ